MSRLINKNPFEIESQFKNMGDSLGMGIDKKIFRSIIILNSLGYKTRQSCEGHVDRYSTSPWIDFIWDEKIDDNRYFKESILEFNNTIFQDLKDFYKDRKVSYDQILSFRKLGDRELILRLSQLENSKCFQDKRAEKLNNYLKEINDFCEFLNQKYKLKY